MLLKLNQNKPHLPVCSFQVLNFGTHGMQRDHIAAMHYLQRAAVAGVAEAAGQLGHMHANGLVRIGLEYVRFRKIA